MSVINESQFQQDMQVQSVRKAQTYNELPILRGERIADFVTMDMAGDNPVLQILEGPAPMPSPAQRMRELDIRIGKLKHFIEEQQNEAGALEKDKQLIAADEAYQAVRRTTMELEAAEQELAAIRATTPTKVQAFLGELDQFEAQVKAVLDQHRLAAREIALQVKQGGKKVQTNG